MNRRLILAASTVALVGVAALPATAAPKPKAFKGSYTLNLNPDPTGEVTGFADSAAKGTGCTNLIDASTHRKAITVPGKGSLKVNLVGGGVDWDLYILKPTGAKAPNTGFNADEELDSSAGETANEQTITKFTKKTSVIIEVCNLLGTPAATVTYSYKP
jgi:hypothetical protein